MKPYKKTSRRKSLLPFLFIAIVVIGFALYVAQNSFTLFGRAASPVRRGISGRNSTTASCGELFGEIINQMPYVTPVTGDSNNPMTLFRDAFVDKRNILKVNGDGTPIPKEDAYFFGDIKFSGSTDQCSKLINADVSGTDCIINPRLACYLVKNSGGKNVDGELAKISICPVAGGGLINKVCTVGGGVSCWNYDPDPIKVGEPKALTLCRQYSESCNDGAGTRLVQVGGCDETSGTKSCKFTCRKASNPAGAYDGNCQDNKTSGNGTCIILQDAKRDPSNTPTLILKASNLTTIGEKKCSLNLSCEILSDRKVYGKSTAPVTDPFPKTQQEEAEFLKKFSLVSGQYNFTKGQYRQSRVISRSSMTKDGKNIYIDRCAEKRVTIVEEGMCSFLK